MSRVNFTADQEDAIRWKQQDACIVAGPGSGKTTVLVERYRSLIVDSGFEPREILAITFTEKAAANMKAKVAQQFQQYPAMLRELESSWISTIHGFCNRLLRENAIGAGIDPRFILLDAREADVMQFESLNAALDEFTDLRRRDVLELIPALHTPEMTGDLISAIDAMRSAGKTVAEIRDLPSPTPPLSPREMAGLLRGLLSDWATRVTPLQATHRSEMLEFAEHLEACENAPMSALASLVASGKFTLNQIPTAYRPGIKTFRETLASWATDRSAAPWRAMVFDILARFEELYASKKTAAAALDFNDLERRTIALLRGNPAVSEKVRKQFRQIMLDEFQDINEQQWDLIRLIRDEDTFFAVGDDNQSIYGFRHARPQIFHEYERTVVAQGKHSVSLLHNFRSRNGILQSVESLLNGTDGIRPRELTAGRQFPDAAHAPVEILRVPSGGEETGVREARWIAYRILALGRSFRDYAVLCRNSDTMHNILDALTQAEIPYVCGRRPSYLVSREGRDLTALLQIVANPRDSIALATVLRSNLAGVSDEGLLRLRMLGSSITGGLNSVVFNPSQLDGFSLEDATALKRFGANLQRWREAQPVLPLDVLLSKVLSDCGVLLNANLESFLQLARTRGNNRSLRNFLAEIESLQKAAGTESELSDEDQGDCVQVMTAHAAKGLEFKVTIIAGMDRGTQHTTAPVTFTPQFGLGLKWHDARSRDGVADSWHNHNAEDLKQRDKDESNRLLYVAMTRAEEHLILSWSVGEKKPSNWAKLVQQWWESKPDTPLLITDTEGEPPQLPASGRAPATEVPVIAAPPIDGQFDSTVNVTSLTVFARCPRRYYLQRYIGWSGGRARHFDPEDLPDEDTNDTGTPAAELGSEVHEILAGRTGTYSEEAHDLAAVFVQSDWGRRAAACNRSAREWDFIIDISGTLVRGSIDLWFEENGLLHIVDYKTDLEVRPEGYTTQLALYAHALEQAIGVKPETAQLYFLRSNQVIPVPVDARSIAAAINVIASLREAQEQLTFPMNQAEHCRTCPFYRGLCPASILNA